MQSVKGVFKVRGAADRPSWYELTGTSGIKLHTFPRPGTTISEHTQTLFKAKEISDDETVCDIILDAPVLTRI
ncbi:uncharacterized protein N7469_002034 [Penicillium citrinum]|uniref:Uncharacterized protein n=1 Tax=Penicillium citrinum TaxID=5077 RepID=A0A9W9TTT2_PENCI|nr:uncharacterized protein N7469_002034 [Penicillium citrinum]KAJ5240443.1 hypothetical protein N7469_002034 [Penicillium citrinum]